MSQLPNIPKLISTPSNGNSAADSSINKRLFEDKQKRPDMGPRWSEEELDIFLKYFRKNQLDDIELMQQELKQAGFKRSIDNLKAVFLKNKNFLTYNVSCSARDLAAIMADHYETMESEIQLVPQRQASKSKEVLSETGFDKKRNIPSLTSKSGNFLDDSIRSKYPEDSRDQKRKHAKVQRSQYSSDESENIQHHKPKKIHLSTNFQERMKRTRKSQTVKGKFPLNFNFNDPDLLKNAEIWSRTCLGKSNRRSNSQRRSSQETIYPLSFLKFLDCESFYSTLDEPYFSTNEFDILFKENKKEIKYTMPEWNLLRRCMGKPRRFSPAFIKSQMQDMNAYRQSTRNYLSKKAAIPEGRTHPLLVAKIQELKPLQVSQVVLAIHPQCHHIHAGSILTITEDRVIIKFFPTELGAMSVSDIKVRVLNSETAAQIMENFNASNLRLTGIPMNRSLSEHDLDKASLQNKMLVQDLDFNALSLFIQILERKTKLVNNLKSLNDRAENDRNAVDKNFKLEYGWTGVQIKLLDDALKHIVPKARLRGLNNYSADQISNNLNLLMVNPLKKTLSELEQKNGEEMDPKLAEEIKAIINKNLEKKISLELKNLTEKYKVIESKEQEEKANQEEAAKPNQEETLKEENNEEEPRTDEKAQEEGENVENVEKAEKVEKEPVEEETEKRLSNLKQRVVEDDDIEKRKDLERMVNNMIGVMLSLKLSGDLNMTENPYLTDLHNHIFEGNSEEFHEINTVLLNICSK